MKELRTLIPKYDDLSYKIKNILKYYYDENLFIDQLIKNNSGLDYNINSFISKDGIDWYRKYDKSCIRFIINLSLVDAIKIYRNDSRTNNRDFLIILNNCITGNFGELTVAIEYGLSYKEFKNQITEKIKLDSGTAFDLLINDKKIEVKTANHKYIYDDRDSCIPIDNSNNDKDHPREWRLKLGKFDIMVICYVWNGRFRIMNELLWKDYYSKSFFYGTGRGYKGDYYRKKIEKDDYLKRKIIISCDYLYPQYTYFSRKEV